MMGGLLVSLVIRRRRIWVRVTPCPARGNVESTGTVNVELGGLARTDNSGWGDEFERLTERLLAGQARPDFPAVSPTGSEEKV
jgi:cytochrome c biogenesis protein